MRTRAPLRLRQLVERPDVAIGHAFQRPPYGGSNQFLLALRGELRRRGLRVAANVISPRTRACVLNAHVFDAEALRRMLHPGCRVVHRVDGPLGVYRGFDDGTDRRVAALNHEFADLTVVQSRYSLETQRELGFEFRDPVVIPNAVDPAIFFPPTEPRHPFAGRKIRLISTSWSDNPNKGAATYKWLEEHLDWSRFDYTFVGRSAIGFERIASVPPVASERVAELLREHDVFVFASLHESCSNALLEALACGLPALYVTSGGNAEIAGDSGLAFSRAEELPELLDRLVE